MMLQDNQKLVVSPLPFVKIPPGHYCVIKDPIDKRYSVGVGVGAGQTRSPTVIAASL
jgi:hypothetical protein